MLAGVSAFGCSSSSAGGSAADAGAMLVASPSSAPAPFAQVYAQVITQRCAPCHTDPAGVGVEQGMLDMSSQAAAYANLVNTPAAGVSCGGNGTRVVPGKPDMSVMYLKVSLGDPAPCGDKMPLGGPPLTVAEASMIQSWIASGAAND